MRNLTYQEKRDGITALLDQWEHYFQPGGSLNGGDGTGTGTASLSTMASSPQVVELVRCMELCRRMAPNHYKHLIGYFGAEWRLADETVKVPSPMNPRKMVDKIVRVRKRVVPAWVVWRIVDRALDFLVAVWAYPQTTCEACKSSAREYVSACPTHVRLELPMALRLAAKRRLVEFTDQNGTHLTEAA